MCVRAGVYQFAFAFLPSRSGLCKGSRVFVLLLLPRHVLALSITCWCDCKKHLLVLVSLRRLRDCDEHDVVNCGCGCVWWAWTWLHLVGQTHPYCRCWGIGFSPPTAFGYCQLSFFHRICGWPLADVEHSRWWFFFVSAMVEVLFFVQCFGRLACMEPVFSAVGLRCCVQQVFFYSLSLKDISPVQYSNRKHLTSILTPL